MTSNSNHMDDTFLQPDGNGMRQNTARESFWKIARTLYAWRRFILAVSFGIAVLAAIIVLLVPNWYKASATVLVPEGGGGGLSALFQNLPSAASSILGGSSGDYVRYMAILNSHSVMSAAVDSFNLVEVYETGDSRNPRESAISTFRENVEVELDMEYDFLSVAVIDHDRERAAGLANFLVRRLNALNTQLSSQNAGNYRRHIENRYFEARQAMDSVLTATADFQRTYGVFDLPAQAGSFFEQVGELRANALEAEIQYEALREQYGAENPRVESFREIAAAANRKYQNALDGRERLLPVPQSEIPEVGRQYVNLEIERTIQQAILEIVGPMYEQAKLQEERDAHAVQVLDEALPPVKKAGPKRTFIVLFAGVSAFILVSLFVLLWVWWDENHRYVAAQLNGDVHATKPEKEAAASR